MTDETENKNDDKKDDAATTKQPPRTRPVIRPRAKPSPDKSGTEQSSKDKQEPTLAADAEKPGADEDAQKDDGPRTEGFSATRDDGVHASAPKNDMSNRDWAALGMRLAFMFVSAFLCALAFHVAGVLVILQALVVIISDEPNETITEWITQLGAYVKTVFAYLSWQTDEKPFPLNGDD